MCQKKEQVKLCRINVKKTFPVDVSELSPEEREEYNRIFREESQGNGISIYDYYGLDQNDI